MTKIYKSIDEWYHPEIDYFEMVNKFSYTEQSMSMKGEFPKKYLFMVDFSNQWQSGHRKQQQMFQFWNKQFNDELVKVINLITGLHKPRLILDVCAGDGRLAQILTQRGFEVKAVDNYEWPFIKRYHKVEQMNYTDALEKYQPDFLIGCWMPYQTNWTPDFRKTKSVKYYMIIGEDKGGCCGGEWKNRKGWNLRYHDEATRYALSRTDSVFMNIDKKNVVAQHHSRVYTFSRDES